MAWAISYRTALVCSTSMHMCKLRCYLTYVVAIFHTGISQAKTDDDDDDDDDGLVVTLIDSIYSYVCPK